MMLDGGRAMAKIVENIDARQPSPSFRRWQINRMNMIDLAYRLLGRTRQYVKHARQFFYELALADHACPQCAGQLAMVGEGRCRCTACGQACDPTVTFQRCSTCGGQPELRIRCYRCRECGQEIASQFLFDGLVFDPEYFRRKTAEHRRRKKQQAERVRNMLAESRSLPMDLSGADLDSIPGLVGALDALTSMQATVDEDTTRRSRFDLAHYQRHIRHCVSGDALDFDEIPPLDDDLRLDRIWRFVAVVFLSHAGHIEVWQDGQSIMVIQREVDGEGQDVCGKLEEADELEGPVGRAETC